MKQWACAIVVFLTACTSTPMPLSKDGPQPVSEQSLVRPPWEALVKAGPGAGDDIDLETLNGPEAAAPIHAEVQPQVAQTEPAEQVVLPKTNVTAKTATTIKAVAVLPVLGASQQANRELTLAMRKVLRDAGWPVLTAPRRDAIAIQGKVTLDEAQGAAQGVHIRWSIAEPKGKVLGDVAQNNQIAAHSLDSAWGQTAELAAQAAANGIFKLIGQYK